MTKDDDERVVMVRMSDLEVLLDRIVYAPTWTPDTLADLDGNALEAIGRCLHAWEAVQAQ